MASINDRWDKMKQNVSQATKESVVNGKELYEKQKEINQYGNVMKQDLAWSQVRQQWSKQSKLVKYFALIVSLFILALCILGLF